jgi:hypothetical protein
MTKLDIQLVEFEEKLQNRSNYGAKCDILVYRLQNRINKAITTEERKYIDTNLTLMLRSLTMNYK